MRRLAKYFFLFVAGCASLSAATFTFVCFDAGETYPLIRVVEKGGLAEESQFLGMATGAAILSKSSLLKVETSWTPQGRLAPLDDLTSLEKIQSRYVITGLYSTAQYQIAQALHARGQMIIGFWDNYSGYDALPPDLTLHIEEFMKICAHILVPTQAIADDLNQRFHSNKAIAVGQPMLDECREKIASADREKLRDELGGNKPWIVYLGGYEENGNGYAQSFSLFVEGLQSLGNHYQLLIQPHPRSGGKPEEALLASSRLHWKISTLSPYEALQVADVVVTHRSTLGVQALFAGKQVLFVDLPGTRYTNFAIEQHLATQCTTPQQVTQALSSAEPATPKDLYAESGIVPHGTANIIQFLNALPR